ncbi:MAG: hypothetical protein JO006_14835 [Paucibacter sp.]|nr:hypothetical protein [Roseateles sp.]
MRRVFGIAAAPDWPTGAAVSMSGWPLPGTVSLCGYTAVNPSGKAGCSR